MGMMISFPDHRPSYSRPKIQIVSHVRIQAVPLSNINGRHFVAVGVCWENRSLLFQGARIPEPMLPCLTISVSF